MPPRRQLPRHSPVGLMLHQGTPALVETANTWHVSNPPTPFCKQGSGHIGHLLARSVPCRREECAVRGDAGDAPEGATARRRNRVQAERERGRAVTAHAVG